MNYKSNWISWSAILLLFFAALSASAAVVSTNATQMFIIRLQKVADVDKVIQDFSLKPRFIYRHALHGFAVELDPATRDRLRTDARVRAMDADDGKLMPCGQTVPNGIIRMGLTNFPMTRLNGLDNHRINVNVAVLDTGIQTNHPDLNVVQWVSFGGGNGDDYSGHGTHVAGIIGALDNDIGVVGVAPGVNLWSVQVLGPYQSSVATLIAGLDYVAANADQIEVANCSLTAIGSAYAVLHEAVTNVINLGVVIVAAAGNSMNDIFGYDLMEGASTDILPAAFPEVMAVSAMDSDPTNSDGSTNVNFDLIWFNGNYSSVPKSPSYVSSPGLGMDVSAPGVNIYSTFVNSGYMTLSGTSMACAHVSGLVALYIAANGRAHSFQDVMNIRQALVNYGQPQSQWNPPFPVYEGWPNDPGTGDPDGNFEPLAVASESWVPQPAFTGVTNTQGGFQLSFAAVPGYNYTVQSTPDLGGNTWSNLSTVTCTGTVATVTFTDTNLATAAFYRLARQPAP